MTERLLNHAEAMVRIRGVIPNASRSAVLHLAIAVTIALGSSSCRPATDEGSRTAKVEEPQAAPKPQVLHFDRTLRVEDEAVNQFLERAIEAYAKGDYERVRLMWTARGEPISQADFEQSWHPVQRVTIRALERVMLAGAAVGSPEKPEPGYAFVADVQFEPDALDPGDEPGREVPLTMVWEHDQWRLATAPEGMRLWLDSKLGRAEIGSPPARPAAPPGP